jgi:hypothetical protein
MQAAVASILDLRLEDVPHFISFGEKWWSTYVYFLKEHGFVYSTFLHNKLHNSLWNTQSDCFIKPKYHRPSIITKKCLYKEDSINGYFLASVLSPGNITFKTEDHRCTHAVVIDRDFNIIHDPNPNYQTVLQYPLAHLIGFNGVINVDLVKKIKQ